MADEKEFQKRVQQIGRLIAALNQIADPEARTSVQALVQSVMELHGIGVERMMEVIFAQGMVGAEIIDRLGSDRMVSSLLVLHGLHPDPIETRVARAVEKVAAQLYGQGVELQLLEAGETVVRIRARIETHACGSTRAAVRSAIEETVYEAAPEIAALSIEGLDGKDGRGFVGLDQLTATSTSLAKAEAGD